MQLVLNSGQPSSSQKYKPKREISQWNGKTPMNFIYENGPLAKIVAFLIGSTIMCVVVLIVWCHRKNQLRRKRNKQETIKLRRELARNKM